MTSKEPGLDLFAGPMEFPREGGGGCGFPGDMDTGGGDPG